MPRKRNFARTVGPATNNPRSVAAANGSSISTIPTTPASNLWNSRPPKNPAAPSTLGRIPDNVHDQPAPRPPSQVRITGRTNLSRESHETHSSCSCPHRHFHLLSARCPRPAHAPAHHRHRARPHLFHRSLQVARFLQSNSGHDTRQGALHGHGEPVCNRQRPPAKSVVRSSLCLRPSRKPARRNRLCHTRPCPHAQLPRCP